MLQHALYTSQEHFYTPCRQAVINGQTQKLTAHGHIEERLRMLRKFEGVRARQPRNNKRVAPVESDETGNNHFIWLMQEACISEQAGWVHPANAADRFSNTGVLMSLTFCQNSTVIIKAK